MRQRLWQHLADTHAMHRDQPETWTVHMPAQFQKLTGHWSLRRDGHRPALRGHRRPARDRSLQRPAYWGRPLVTFPHPGTAWAVPTSGWHLDSQDLELTMVVVFAHLAPVRPGPAARWWSPAHTGSPRQPDPRRATLRSAHER
jgi:hypothetical protein